MALSDCESTHVLQEDTTKALGSYICGQIFIQEPQWNERDKRSLYTGSSSLCLPWDPRVFLFRSPALAISVPGSFLAYCISFAFLHVKVTL